MQDRGIPIEKIRAIVAKGQGVPDSDCPDIASLTRFWISTSTKEIDLDEVRQQGQVTIQASAASAVDGVLTPFASSATTLGADGMQSILQGLGAAGTTTPGLRVGFELLFGFSWGTYFVSMANSALTNACKTTILICFRLSPPLLSTCRRWWCRSCWPCTKTKAETKAETKGSCCRSFWSASENSRRYQIWDWFATQFPSWKTDISLANIWNFFSLVNLHPVYTDQLSSLCFWGSALKKELTQVTNVALELDGSNPLRKNLESYKKRIEEYLDEWLGIQP